MLELDIAPDRVEFRRDDSAAERIWTDGRPSIVDADNPDVRLGAWEADTLFVERSSARGTRVVEAWRRVGPDLVASFEIRNGLLEEPLTFELYFLKDAAE